MSSYKMGVTEETDATVMEEKNARKTSPLLYSIGLRQKAYFNSSGYNEGCGQIGCTKTIR